MYLIRCLITEKPIMNPQIQQAITAINALKEEIDCINNQEWSETKKGDLHEIHQAFLQLEESIRQSKDKVRENFCEHDRKIYEQLKRAISE